ncbi:MAG: Elongation factor Ts [Chlamydiae bacterium]|nr:Elongation factor Ts [Chlamydiota bacterium]
MSKITAELIKELRERTGVGMGKCKAALEESGGDLELAIENLRKAGMASAVKKEGREANEGSIGIGESDKAFAFVEVNSETDFVSQNEKFKQFLKDVSEEAALTQPKDLDTFLAQKCHKDESLTIDEYRALIIQSLGENIQIKRIALLPKDKNFSIGIYSHMSGRIVTAVEMTGGEGNEILARDIAMHIAAESPEYLRPEDVPAKIKAREEDIAKSQVEGKPANIIDKIITGKVNSYYDQVCLLRQKYVKDGSVTVEALLKREGKEADKTFEIKNFYRWQVGE